MWSPDKKKPKVLDPHKQEAALHQNELDLQYRLVLALILLDEVVFQLQCRAIAEKNRRWRGTWSPEYKSAQNAYAHYQAFFVHYNATIKNANEQGSLVETFSVYDPTLGKTKWADLQERLNISLDELERHDILVGLESTPLCDSIRAIAVENKLKVKAPCARKTTAPANQENVPLVGESAEASVSERVEALVKERVEVLKNEHTSKQAKLTGTLTRKNQDANEIKQRVAGENTESYDTLSDEDKEQQIINHIKKDSPNFAVQLNTQTSEEQKSDNDKRLSFQRKVTDEIARYYGFPEDQEKTKKNLLNFIYDGCPWLSRFFSLSQEYNTMKKVLELTTQANVTDAQIAEAVVLLDRLDYLCNFIELKTILLEERSNNRTASILPDAFVSSNRQKLEVEAYKLGVYSKELEQSAQRSNEEVAHVNPLLANDETTDDSESDNDRKKAPSKGEGSPTGSLASNSSSSSLNSSALYATGSRSLVSGSSSSPVLGVK